MNPLTLLPLANAIDTEVAIPGSKSYTIRALVLAALTSGPVRILNPLVSDDTVAMLGCLKTLGLDAELVTSPEHASLSNTTDKATNVTGKTVSAPVNATESASWIDVRGHIHDVKPGDYLLDTDLSAASLRFLLAMAAVLPGRQILQGKEGLNKRPVRDLVDALRALGAEVEYLKKDGYPPVRVNSSALKANTVQVSGSVSSQYVSALMMLAPAAGGLTLELVGEATSKPYLDMTASTMAAFGVTVQNDDYRRIVVAPGQTYHASLYVVEGDASSASYYMAVAALTHSRITLRNLPADSAQADMQFLEILERMGTRVERHPDRIVVEGHGVQPITVDMKDCPDQAQTMAVLAAFANGTTRIEGLKSLRVKETDRLAAVATELTRMGVPVEEAAEAITIHGGAPKHAAIETYGDHRMAMAFAVAGSKMSGLEIRDPQVVSKTYPEFWRDWQALGIGVCPEKASEPADKIVLIGFMGAGKTLLAEALAKALNIDAVEMDALIVQRSGRGSVVEIFDLDGETRFRELEIETAKALRDKRQVVVSTGGGLVMNKIAVDYLSECGTVVFLETSLETLSARLQSDTERPLMQDKRKVESLYALRHPLYRHYASVHIVTDGKSPEALVQEIIAVVRPDCGTVSPASCTVVEQS